MKKIIFRILVICSAVLLFCMLGSCNMPVSETQGGFEIMLPSRADDPMYDRTGETYFVRVYLIFNNVIYPLQGNVPYLEAEITREQRSITMDAIPAGTFRLCLGIGTKNNIGAFNVQYYSESEEFTLVAGSTVDVNCPYAESPVVILDELLGVPTKGVVSNGAYVYTSSMSTVYSYSYSSGFFPELSNTISSGSINMITNGLSYTGGAPASVLFLSTSTGISLCNPSTLFITPGLSDPLGVMNVLKTLAYSEGTSVTLYFQRQGGFGGVYLDGTPEWADVDHSDFVKGEFVRDFVVTSGLTPNYSFFSTALGAFRLPTSLLSGYTGGSLRFLSAATFFKIVKNNRDLPILSLGYDTSGTRAFFIGTSDGVYETTLNETTGTFETTPALIAATEGNKITDIVINANYHVFASNSYLFIRRMFDGVVIALPAVAGIPGVINGIAWHGDILVVSGSEGLVALDPDSLGFPAY